MTCELTVWFEDEPIGTFAQSDDGRQSFVYHESWLAAESRFPISLSMPLRADPFEDPTARAFFGGLLPDDDVRRRLARFLGVSARNEFALLAEVGRECAGAIAMFPPGQRPPQPTDDVRVLSDDELAALLAELPTRPLLVGKDVRLSLAGAQDKIALRLVDGGFALPTGGGPTTHIVKTPIDGYDDTVPNECFCMRLARIVGLSAPSVEMRVVGDTEILVIERFDRDRERDAGGRLHRRHQEDFCQALGVPPERKYQSEGGPRLVQMFELLTAHSPSAAVDRIRLLDMVLFHYVIGNADAHGKNYSLLLDHHGAHMAPVYDAMCTLVYPRLGPRMAMKIGSAREFDSVLSRHWETFAKSVGLAPGFVNRRLGTLAASLRESAMQLSASEERFSASATIAAIRESIDSRCARFG